MTGSLPRRLILPGERMLQLGQGSAPGYALLVSGDRGRCEQTLKGANRYFLLQEEQAPRFLLFRRQVAALMQECGLQGREVPIWHGSLRGWSSFLGEAFAREEPPAPENFLAALPLRRRAVSPVGTSPPRGNSGSVELADLIFSRVKRRWPQRRWPRRPGPCRPSAAATLSYSWRARPSAGRWPWGASVGWAVA